ncbi:hypothetical protein FVB9288_00072 [Flavobacterium sp. CECT 9288]|nr:hypothetical protein FVB9288_00072 [Flavobacterium sp. CECT 9288]
MEVITNQPLSIFQTENLFKKTIKRVAVKFNDKKNEVDLSFN